MTPALSASAVKPRRLGFAASLRGSSGERLQHASHRSDRRTQASLRSQRSVNAKACGILGVFTEDSHAAIEMYEGLLMLQHRGQDSAGMVTFDGSKFKERKDRGLVKDVFDEDSIHTLEGQIGIGHVRYPTAGEGTAADAQPFFVNSPLGIHLIHNGNLTNAALLKNNLEHKSELSYFRHLRSQSDSEVLLNVFADEIHRAHLQGTSSSARTLVFRAARQAMTMLQGAYSAITLINKVGLFAFRDPHGIRPLVIGHRTNAKGTDEWTFASEDSAFGPLGFSRVRDVEPGEAVLVTLEGELVTQQCLPGKLNPCIFEYIYLARPDSTINNISVYEFQLSLGRRLAERITETGWELDTVVPVPDGSRPAAIEIASALKLPYREGLVKNRYVGRTFIMPSQSAREVSVRRKLNAMNAVFKDKKILLVDDSIVRGTTMRQILSMVRKAGAKKVYLASASPPVRFPNVYGVDMPSRREFVANGLSSEEICTALNADGLVYQDISDLMEAGRSMNPHIERFDASCFDGHYVTGDISDEDLVDIENDGRGKGRSVSNGHLSGNGNGNGSHAETVGLS